MTTRTNFKRAGFRRILPLILSSALLTAGCRSTRVAEAPAGPHFHVLTYNVNWGAPGPDLAAQIIRESGADIICLQETTPEWEQYLRTTLKDVYPHAEFRSSKMRMGGGLAFLSKTAGREVAYIPSDTGWFDGWLMAFDTAAGPVQVMNVHLRPPISDSGSWVSGYFTTRDDRLREMERFYARRDPELPMLVLGDFNDTDHSQAVDWLKARQLSNALPQFDPYTPTWQMGTSMITLRRRMDHILYSPELHCCSARVLRAGASDHFPVEAVFTRDDFHHEHEAKENLAREAGRSQGLSQSF
jgi:endonuclease/exonuclease/phosphatase family metal-dependent hydrolase